MAIKAKSVSVVSTEAKKDYEVTYSTTIDATKIKIIRFHAAVEMGKKSVIPSESVKGIKIDSQGVTWTRARETFFAPWSNIIEIISDL